MSRCLDQVVSLRRKPPVFSPQASFGLSYRPTEGKKGSVDLAQSEVRIPDLWCGSTKRYHLATGPPLFLITL
ncbi:hypothetical protein TNCV_84221 [Trichonephila clavipes]|nr:hypothetical protein TNCV_84221 [Trichonephila clavipes]